MAYTVFVTIEYFSGNHEYNAIAYFTSDGKGGHLRERSVKNNRQHQAFIDAYAGNPREWSEIIKWFKGLPLWLDLEGLRVVHACWDPLYVKRISEEYDNSALLNDALLRDSSTPGTWQYKAVETLLKGKEILLPDGASFDDKDGNSRHEIRVRWWGKGKTYRDVYMGPESAVTHVPGVGSRNSDCHERNISSHTKQTVTREALHSRKPQCIYSPPLTK
jgi:hypothetical protein